MNAFVQQWQSLMLMNFMEAQRVKLLNDQGVKAKPTNKASLPPPSFQMPKTPFSEILKQMPHLNGVNRQLDLGNFANAKFYIMKSFTEENIFKVSCFLRFLTLF